MLMFTYHLRSFGGTENTELRSLAIINTVLVVITWIWAVPTLYNLLTRKHSPHLRIVAVATIVSILNALGSDHILVYLLTIGNNKTLSAVCWEYNIYMFCMQLVSYHFLVFDRLLLALSPQWSEKLHTRNRILHVMLFFIFILFTFFLFESLTMSSQSLDPYNIFQVLFQIVLLFAFFVLLTVELLFLLCHLLLVPGGNEDCQLSLAICIGGIVLVIDTVLTPLSIAPLSKTILYIWLVVDTIVDCFPYWTLIIFCAHIRRTTQPWKFLFSFKKATQEVPAASQQSDSALVPL